MVRMRSRFGTSPCRECLLLFGNGERKSLGRIKYDSATPQAQYVDGKRKIKLRDYCII